MTPSSPGWDASIVYYLCIKFPAGFEPCWAGPRPAGPGFCFGSLNGNVLLTDEEGTPTAPVAKCSPSGEAVNGMACVGTWLAVSTREEVSFFPLAALPGEDKSPLAFPYGAHGVSATASGYFIAPMGRPGIMAMRPPITSTTPVIVHGAEHGSLYAYRAVVLHSNTDGEVLACAARRGGLAVGKFSGTAETNHMRTANFNDMDVVDICPLDPTGDTLAVAVLTRDGNIFLFRDVLRDAKPLKLTFRKVHGVAYRLLSCRGDVYVLTSDGVFVLGKLSGRFLDNELASGTITPVLPLPMNALDAAVIGDRWLLVVLPGEVRRFDAEVIYGNVPGGMEEGEKVSFEGTTLRPDLLWLDVDHKKHEYAMTGIA
jgi:hypothetical protein